MAPKRRAKKKPTSSAPPPELPNDVLAIVAQNVAAHIYKAKTNVASLRLIGPLFKKAVDAEIKHVMHTLRSGVVDDASPARRCGFTKNALCTGKNIATHDFATFDALHRHVCVLCKGHFSGGVNALGILAHDECVRAASISTTYFDGGGGDRIAAASPRALELVQANPWFTAKIADDNLATASRSGWNKFHGAYSYRQALALPCPMIEPRRTVVGFLEHAVATNHPAYVATQVKAALNDVLDAVVAPAELAAAADRRRRVVEALAAGGIDLVAAESDHHVAARVRELDARQWRDVELCTPSSVVEVLKCFIKERIECVKAEVEATARRAEADAEAAARRTTLQKALRKRKLLRRDDPGAYDAYVRRGHLPSGVATMDALVLAIAARATRAEDLEAALAEAGVTRRDEWKSTCEEFHCAGTLDGEIVDAGGVIRELTRRQVVAEEAAEARRCAAELSAARAARQSALKNAMCAGYDGSYMHDCVVGEYVNHGTLDAEPATAAVVAVVVMRRLVETRLVSQARAEDRAEEARVEAARRGTGCCTEHSRPAVVRVATMRTEGTCTHCGADATIDWPATDAGCTPACACYYCIEEAPDARTGTMLVDKHECDACGRRLCFDLPCTCEWLADADRVAHIHRRKSGVSGRCAGVAQATYAAGACRACTSDGCTNKHRMANPAVGPSGPICGGCERKL